MIASVVVLLALAAPALSMRLGQTDAGTLSTTSTQRRAYDLLGTGFGKGFNGPLLLVAEVPAGSGTTALTGVAAAVAKDPQRRLPLHRTRRRTRRWSRADLDRRGGDLGRRRRTSRSRWPCQSSRAPSTVTQEPTVTSVRAAAATVVNVVASDHGPPSGRCGSGPASSSR